MTSSEARAWLVEMYRRAEELIKATERLIAAEDGVEYFEDNRVAYDELTKEEEEERDGLEAESDLAGQEVRRLLAEYRKDYPS